MAEELDAQIAELLRAADEAGVPPVHSMPYVLARDFYLLSSQKLAGDSPNKLDVSDFEIDTTAGRMAIRRYRVAPGVQARSPALIYFHGGGWCIGGLDSHDHVCRWLAAESGCVVMSVDYRLAPEHKFPAAVEDALAATTWVFENADSLAVDVNRIGIGGDSAGGNLSAVVTLMAKEQGGPRLACQLLIYPATDMLMRFPSHVTNGDGYRLTRTAILWFINGYLRSGEDMYDWRASPLMADDHSGLPPAFVLTAGFDPLLDEGEAYATLLRDAGVAVQYRCYAGMVHGFIAMPGAVDTAKSALRDAAAYLRQQLSA